LDIRIRNYSAKSWNLYLEKVSSLVKYLLKRNRYPQLARRVFALLILCSIVSGSSYQPRPTFANNDEWPILHSNWDFFAESGSTNEVGELELNTSVRGEFNRSSKQSYYLDLNAGQYLHIVLAYSDTNVTLKLYSPLEKEVAEIGNAGSIQNSESLSFIAQATGLYRLEVRHSIVETCPHRSQYELQLKELRPSAPQDVNQIKAQNLYLEGVSHQLRETKESFQNAVKKYQESLIVLQDCEDPVRKSNTNKNIGDIYSILGENQKAVTYYNQALLIRKTMRDSRGEAEILNDLTSTYINLGQTKEALVFCRNAIELSKRVGDRRTEEKSLNNIGLINYIHGDMQSALGFFNQVLDLERSGCDRSVEAEALTNIGYVHNDLGNVSDALKYYDKALRIWRDLKDTRGEAFTLRAVGGLHSLLGNKQQALNLLYDAKKAFENLGDRNGEAATLNGIGTIYLDLGENNRALDFHLQSLQISRETNDRILESYTLGYIGKIYESLDSKEKALEYYNRKLSLTRMTGDVRGEAYSLRDVGGLLFSLGDKTTALTSLEQSLLLCRRISDRRGEAYSLNKIGEVFYSSGEWQQALNYYNQALPAIKSVEDRAGESQVLYNIARVNRKLGDVLEARTHIESSINIIDSVRTHLTSLDLRASYIASVHAYYEFYIDLLVQMHKRFPLDGFKTLALEFSERARSRTLVDLLNESPANIYQGVPTDLITLERNLRGLLNAKAERQTRLLNSAKYTGQEVETIKKEIDNIVFQYQNLQGQIRAKSPRYAALTQPKPVTIEQIQELLDQDTILLEYSLGDERSYGWAVTQKEVTTFEIPSRIVIERVARKFYDLITTRKRTLLGETVQQRLRRLGKADEALSRIGEDLGNIVLGPIAHLLETKRRLLVVADGALQYVPFAALLEPGTATDREKKEPLIVKHEIVYLPSVSAFLALRREKVDRVPTKSIAVFADPVFDKDDWRITPAIRKRSTIPLSSQEANSSSAYGLTREAGNYFSRLLYTRWEAEAILSLQPRRDSLKAVDFEASRSIVLDTDLNQYRIVHFATHGLIDDVHPELSGVVLSLVNEKGQQVNGFLRLNDIYNLKLSAELVVLSGCYTALGKEIRGEGLISLTRGFMYAGASRVISTLWAVDDRSTSELMVGLYTRMLKQGLSPAAALRSTQIMMWKDKRWGNPFFWAGITLQGDWK
jgi:CHAT domain-containing protein/tetratricopeptide (TPR) repeat protein